MPFKTLVHVAFTYSSLYVVTRVRKKWLNFNTIGIVIFDDLRAKSTNAKTMAYITHATEIQNFRLLLSLVVKSFDGSELSSRFFAEPIFMFAIWRVVVSLPLTKTRLQGTPRWNQLGTNVSRPNEVYTRGYNTSSYSCKAHLL